MQSSGEFMVIKRAGFLKKESLLFINKKGLSSLQDRENPEKNTDCPK